MTPEEELARMRQLYEYAQPDTHMLVNDEVRLRCRRCRTSPVPKYWFMAQLCDPCLDILL